MKFVYTFLRENNVFIIFLIIGFSVFFNILDNQFVWIDNQYIVNNPQSHTLKIQQLFTASSLTSIEYYRPLAAVYLTVINSIFGTHAFFFHLFQLCIYILNGYIVFIFYRTFFKKTSALFLALIYFLHPLNAGVVAFISSSSDALYIFFGLLALVIVLKYRVKLWSLVLVNALLLMSLLTKESGILFFFATCLYVSLFKKKLAFLYVSSALATLVVYVGIRFYFHGIYFGTSYNLPLSHLSLLQRLQYAPEIFWFYIERFFLPFHITGIYIQTVDVPIFNNFYESLVFDLTFCSGIAALGIFLYKFKKVYLKLYLFFLGILFTGIIIYLQLIPLDYIVSARWFTFALLGLLGIVGITLQFFDSNKFKVPVMICCILYLSFLGIRTMQRNNVWSDEITFFTQAAKNNDNYIVENFLGNAYINQHDYTNAMIHVKKSVQLYAYDNNLAIEAALYERFGNEDQAIRYYYKSLSAKSLGPWQHDNITSQMLGRFLLIVHDYGRGEILLTQAVKDFPQEGGLWVLEAMNEYKLGKSKYALIALKNAELYYPDKQLVGELTAIIQKNQPLNVTTVL